MAVNINVPSQVRTFANLAAFPATGALKTIYIAEDTNKTYRWTGSVYTEISASAAMTWGAIGGTLSNQTDLQSALNAKQDSLGFTPVPTSRTLTINGTTQDLSADRTFTISTGITIGTTAITSGTVGRVLFQGAGNVVQESSSLFWDNTNNRLGIGTSSPLVSLDVRTSDNSPITPLSTVPNTATTFLVGNTGTNGVLSLGQNNTGQGWIQGRSRLGDGSSFPILLNPLGGNILIGTTTDAGFRLDVNGTARVQGNTSVSLNQNATTSLTISNTTSGASAQSALLLNGTAGIYKYSASTTPYKIFASNDFGHYNGVIGDIAILNDVPNGRIKFATNQSNTAQMTLFSSGNLGINTTTDAGFRLDVNGTARVSGVLTCGNNVTAANFIGNIRSDLFLTSNGAFFIFQSNGATGNAKFNQFVSIGTNNEPVASAALDVVSTTKGFLPPRMTTTQKNAIATPATGLQVFDTTLNRPCFYDGTTWITL